jgi:hypothetical protein
LRQDEHGGLLDTVIAALARILYVNLSGPAWSTRLADLGLDS